MRGSVRIIGSTCAVLAALFNATVGVISVNLFSEGFSAESIAFLKCFIAFVILFSYMIIFNKKIIFNKFKSKWLQIIVCAFFGFFILYTFETKAYETLNIAVVVFILFGVSTITTFILEAVLDKRSIHFSEMLSIIFSVLGLSLIFSYEFTYDAPMQGMIFAAISGAGYGLFLVLSKRFNIGSDLSTLTVLLGFGSLYLFISLVFFQKTIPSFSLSIAIPLLLLAILPTIGGFYCTIKALSLLKSQSVQLLELTEPLFALIFAFIFLGQLTTFSQILGGIFIIVAILINEIEFTYIFSKIKGRKARNNS